MLEKITDLQTQKKLSALNNQMPALKKEKYLEHINQVMDRNDEHAYSRKMITVLIAIIERNHTDLTAEEKAVIAEYKQYIAEIEKCKALGREELNK